MLERDGFERIQMMKEYKKSSSQHNNDYLRYSTKQKLKSSDSKELPERVPLSYDYGGDDEDDSWMKMYSQIGNIAPLSSEKIPVHEKDVEFDTNQIASVKATASEKLDPEVGGQMQSPEVVASLTSVTQQPANEMMAMVAPVIPEQIKLETQQQVVRDSNEKSQFIANNNKPTNTTEYIESYIVKPGRTQGTITLIDLSNGIIYNNNLYQINSLFEVTTTTFNIIKRANGNILKFQPGDKIILYIGDKLLKEAPKNDTPKEPEKNLLEIILGGLKGEFNQDPSLPEIGVDFISSIIPIFDQIADARDLAAHLYFMLFKGQLKDIGRWVGLGFTLIGLFPEIGSVIKSLSKFFTKGTKEALQHADEILAAIEKFLPGINVKQLQDYIASHWDEGVVIGKQHWNDFLNLLRTSIEKIPGLSFLGEKKQQALQQLDQVFAASEKFLDQAFAEVRRRIDEVLEALGRRLDPNGNLQPALEGSPGVSRIDDGTQKPLQIEGRDGGNSPTPRNTRFLNIEEARDFIARKIASGERITLDIFGGKTSQISGAINFDIVAEEGIRATIADLAKIFPANSVDEIIANGPQAEFLEEVASILKPKGRIYINGNFANRYRYGTSRGKKPPNHETLERLGLRLVKDDGSLDSRFADLEFYRSDGGEIRKDTVKTIIFEKVE